MKVYFDQFGDHIPNSKDQIHLDPIDKFTIYEEYMQEKQISNIGIAPLCYSKFLIMWTTLFPHVSIREFKAVTGQKFANQSYKISQTHYIYFRQVFVLRVVEWPEKALQGYKAKDVSDRTTSASQEHVYGREIIVLSETKRSNGPS